MSSSVNLSEHHSRGDINKSIIEIVTSFCVCFIIHETSTPYSKGWSPRALVCIHYMSCDHFLSFTNACYDGPYFSGYTLYAYDLYTHLQKSVSYRLKPTLYIYTLIGMQTYSQQLQNQIKKTLGRLPNKNAIVFYFPILNYNFTSMIQVSILSKSLVKGHQCDYDI